MKRTMKQNKSIVLSLVFMMLFSQCGNDINDDDIIEGINEQEIEQTGNEVVSTTFDRSAMLTFLADQIIIPSIADFGQQLDAFQAQTAAFVASPSAEALSTLREGWLASYSAWQFVEMYDLGAAEEIYFKNRMNLFPANVNQIEINISEQNYDLDNSSNFTSQGFAALDYLLFGLGDNEEEILSQYVDNAAYGTYLTEVVAKMLSLTLLVKTDWESSYREGFINSTDNTATSGLNMLINDFVYYYEKGFRANKIGIPAGVFSGSPLPDRIEAFHGEVYAKSLALDASRAIHQFFNGIAFEDTNTTGPSIKAYLDFVEKDVSEKLSDRINAQFQLGKEKIEALDTNFKKQIENDNTAMLYTYDAIQSGVVLLKVDMLQKLNINVDYADADGD